MNESFTKKLVTDCKLIYPIENPTIKKIKVLKRPKMDNAKLTELYSNKNVKANETKEDEESKNLLSRPPANK